ncbi:efflux RND transporter periplasmic adaptor subunit [Idiomarina sp.]|uniref:HlyD family secretion protein n=1 Tax=Idiomarina sp. TaxID=1874361 RepID=UPI0025C5FF06|nr:efflux RND transporter periplasmic adaptor subunit [Idiomarina sp.]
MNKRNSVIAVVAVVLVFFVYLSLNQDEPEYTDIVSGNGRIEAVELNIATKIAGRLEQVWVNDGDFVLSGDKLAQLDTSSLQAELHQAQAQQKQANTAITTAKSQIKQRQAEQQATVALVKQRQAELELAEKRLQRIRSLAEQGSVSTQDLDDARAAVVSTESAVAAAKSQLAASEAAIQTARSQLANTEAAAEAAAATLERVQTQIDDSLLLAPRDGRIQYLIARPGEVVAAGGRVINMVDVSDVYMTVFLPTTTIGKISLGSDARIVLDALPEVNIPAQVSFISDVAQFTPKTVETREEREKLMFRVRVSINKALLQQHLEQVKTGLPGVAYIKFDSRPAWPEALQTELN